MNKINCPRCGFANWPGIEKCIGCRSRVGAGWARHLPVAGSIAGIVLLVAGIYYITRSKPPSPATVQASNSFIERPLTPDEEHSQDAAYWSVSPPSFNEIIEEERKRFLSTHSDSYLISGKEVAPSLPSTYFPDTIEKYPPVYGHCPGKVEDVIVRDYKFMRVDGEMRMHAKIEADLYSAGADQLAKKCLPIVHVGRRFHEVWFIWKPGPREWVRRVEDKESQEKDRQKARDEERAEAEKFQRELKEQEARRARTRQVVKERRAAAARNAAVTPAY